MIFFSSEVSQCGDHQAQSESLVHLGCNTTGRCSQTNTDARDVSVISQERRCVNGPVVDLQHKTLGISKPAVTRPNVPRTVHHATPTPPCTGVITMGKDNSILPVSRQWICQQASPEPHLCLVRAAHLVTSFIRLCRYITPNERHVHPLEFLSFCSATLHSFFLTSFVFKTDRFDLSLLT